MAVPSNRVKKLSADSESVNNQIDYLDRIRAKGRLRADEKRTILRVFYDLYRDSRNRTPHLKVNARARTAKLCGVAIETVCRLVTKWNTSKKNGNTAEANKVVIESSRNGSNTKQKLRVSNDREVFYQVRDLETSKRAARAHVAAT